MNAGLLRFSMSEFQATDRCGVHYIINTVANPRGGWRPYFK